MTAKINLYNDFHHHPTEKMRAEVTLGNAENPSYSETLRGGILLCPHPMQTITMDNICMTADHNSMPKVHHHHHHHLSPHYYQREKTKSMETSCVNSATQNQIINC